MKKLFLIVVLFATIVMQRAFAQDTVQHTSVSPILQSYFDIKNALVAGNLTTASINAEAFIEALNAADKKIISQDDVDDLAKDARKISEAKDIKKQREVFSDFTTNMINFAKKTKLSEETIYVAHCSMKKASWLSNEATIKNPYYGSAMLTCGKVTETLK